MPHAKKPKRNKSATHRRDKHKRIQDRLLRAETENARRADLAKFLAEVTGETDDSKIAQRIVESNSTPNKKENSTA